MASTNTIFLTYTYRLQPTRAQHRRLGAILETQRQLYNEMLDAKQLAWEMYGANITKYDLYSWLVRRRTATELPACLCRYTVDRLDAAFVGFFRRCKAGQTPGYPRFKSQDRFRSFGFSGFSGIRLRIDKLRFKGMTGGLKVRFHRSLPIDSKICSAVFTKDHKGWKISFQLKIPLPEAQVVPTASVGIDVGLSTLAVFSDGSKPIERKYFTKKAAKKLRTRQRALARCQKGANRRLKVKARLTKAHAKIANSRRTYLHQQSADVVKRYGFIAYEKLSIQNMAHGNLAKAIHDAAWGTLLGFVVYKAEKAGCTTVVVNPRGTSQICSRCKVKVPKDLFTRVHDCPHCNLRIDRDLNAAINILNRAVPRPGVLNVTGYREREPGIVSSALPG